MTLHLHNLINSKRRHGQLFGFSLERNGAYHLHTPTMIIESKQKKTKVNYNLKNKKKIRRVICYELIGRAGDKLNPLLRIII